MTDDAPILSFASGAMGHEKPPEEGRISVDLDRLVRTRLLIQAESGGGKSWMIRYLLEQTHGFLPHVLFDLEGEFASLRERYPYVLVSATPGDGDLPARPEAAPTLSRRLSELGASAILDLFDLDADDQQRFVRLFLQELLALPRSMWGPRLIVVDEADRLAPERGSADSAPAIHSLVKRGRKRGLGAVLAVQRLSDLDKGAAGGLQNKLVGLTTLDTDVRRVGDDLGFDKDARASLRELSPGEFFAFGPAIPVKGVTLVRSGPIYTTHEHADESTQLPPPPGELSEILSKLAASLPDEAERAADTRGTDAANVPAKPAAKGRKASANEPSRPSRAEIDREVNRRVEAELDTRVRAAVAEAERRAARRISALQETIDDARDRAADLLASLSGDRSAADEAPGEASHQEAPAGEGASIPKPTARRRPEEKAPANGRPKKSARGRILATLRDLENLGVSALPRNNLAVFAEQGPRSSAFRDHLAALKDEALIAYPSAGAVALTDEGRRRAGAGTDAPAARTLRDLHDAWCRRLRPASAAILSAIVAHHPAEISREQLAADSGQSPKSSAFRDRVAELRSLGLIRYPGAGRVAATDLLFPRGLE